RAQGARDRAQHLPHRRRRRAAPGMARREGEGARRGGTRELATAVSKRRSPSATARTTRARGQRNTKRIFVLDTNVLIHDPTAIFRFDEHDIYLPMIVLEELDAGKKGLSEAARNVRQVS